MLATLIDRPFDSQEWLFEIKWDGYRALSSIHGNSISIYSRNNISFNEKFPEIVNSLANLKTDAILDGEIVVVDDNGRSDFQLLQGYSKNKTGSLVYYVFDILYLDGKILTDMELTDRKKILGKLISGAEDKGYIKISDHIEGEGKKFFRIARENNLEGIIAKKKNSSYQPGKRSKDWLKIRSTREQEVVIAGFTPSHKTNRKIGSLITGVYEKDKLVFAGQVGTGIGSDEIDNIFLKLDRIRTESPPFEITPETAADPQWVRPELVAEVRFTEWTKKGIMRQPVYMGLREDKDPKEVYLEEPESRNIFSETSNGGNKIKNNQKIAAYPDSYGIKVKLKNPDKIFWPKEKYTKKDLFTYYRNISEYILPYIRDRLQSLNRCPDGIDGECFYQKDIDYELPDWLETERIYSKSRSGNIDYLACRDINSLLYMVNLGCIDIHPWNSRISKLKYPDFAVLDLDPLEVSFQEVLKVAFEARGIFDELKIDVFFKTSGSKGIHIYIPLGARYTFEQSLDFIKLLAKILNSRLPELTSLERSPQKRHKKVYLDCYQNRIGQTVAAPYSIRPKPGAPVSTPLAYDELERDIKPSDFNMKNIFSRLEKKGDLWKGVLGSGINMKKCIEKIEKGIGIRKNNGSLYR